MKLLLMLLVAASCSKAPNGWNPFIPRPYNMNVITNYPAGSDYQMGFNAGCQTYQGVVSAGFTRMTPSAINGWYLTGKCDHAKDKKCPQNAALYRSGFSDGMEHCTYHYDWWVL